MLFCEGVGRIQKLLKMKTFVFEVGRNLTSSLLCCPTTTGRPETPSISPAPSIGYADRDSWKLWWCQAFWFCGNVVDNEDDFDCRRILEWGGWFWLQEQGRWRRGGQGWEEGDQLTPFLIWDYNCLTLTSFSPTSSLIWYYNFSPTWSHLVWSETAPMTCLDSQT